MKLVFAILTHKKPDQLLEKLFTFLNGFPDATIVVHHDFSQAEFPEALIKKYNLHMVSPTYQTKWGHISKIPAMQDVMELGAKVTPDFDWLISLSANCYPIKSHEEILQFFKNAKVDYFMEHKPLGMQYEGIYKWHYEALFTRKLITIPSFTRQLKFTWRTLRYKIDRATTPYNDSMYPYTGSEWCYFNRKAVAKIVEGNLKDHPITHYLAKSNEISGKNASPDEIIFQTFVANQRELLGDGNNYRFIDWENSVDWHPNTLTMAHLDKIINSQALFARKFGWPASQELIETIDRELLYATT